MEQQTHLGKNINETEYKAKYDRQVKELLANKQVLARILKQTAAEFADCDIDTIENCIEGKPQVGIVEVQPKHFKGSKPEKITGQPVDSEFEDEGKVTFDIRFNAITEEKIPVKIIVNIEAQKKYHVGYSLVARGIFYCSRMMSEELDTEFTTDDYSKIKKVYSIWICTETPEYLANTITKYEFQPEDVYGHFRGKELYDLMSVGMIRLSKKEHADEKNDLIHMLTVLLSHTIKAEEKKKILSEKHKMRMTREITEGVRNMCNLSDAIEEKGIEKGMEKGIEKGQSFEKCNTIRAVYQNMNVEAIVRVFQYEKSFVEKVVALLKQTPLLSNEDIVKNCGLNRQ